MMSFFNVLTVALLSEANHVFGSTQCWCVILKLHDFTKQNVLFVQQIASYHTSNASTFKPGRFQAAKPFVYSILGTSFPLFLRWVLVVMVAATLTKLREDGVVFRVPKIT